MNRTRLCEFPLAGSWLPWHSCGRPWALFRDAGMLQGRFDPLESWWVRRASTPLVGRETSTTPAIWGCSSCSLGVFLRGFLSPMPYWVLSSKLTVGGLCIFRRTLSLSSCLLSQLRPTPAGCVWVPGIGSTLSLPAAWMPLQLSPGAAPSPTWHTGSWTLLLCQLYFKGG